MKKLTLIIGLVLLTILLVSCNDTVKKDNFKFEGNTYTYEISYKDKKVTEDSFKESAYNAIYDIYETHKSDIGSSKRYFDITITVNDDKTAHLIYVVNQSIENPGLKLLSEKF